MNDENILKTVKWMPIDYFYKFRLLTITYKAFYNLDLEEINSLVVKSMHILYNVLFSDKSALKRLS